MSEEDVTADAPAVEEKPKGPTLFICGPMSQTIPNYNSGMFRGSAAMLRNAGYEVVDPFELTYGENKTSFSPAAPFEFNSRLTESALLQCGAVATLDGWQGSSSCWHEVNTALRCGMPVASVDFWLSLRSGE